MVYVKWSTCRIILRNENNWFPLYITTPLQIRSIGPRQESLLEADSLNQIITNYQRRLQILREQQAKKGLEINDRYFKGTYDPVIRNLVGLVRSLLIR